MVRHLKHHVHPLLRCWKPTCRLDCQSSSDGDCLAVSSCICHVPVCCSLRSGSLSWLCVLPRSTVFLGLHTQERWTMEPTQLCQWCISVGSSVSLHLSTRWTTWKVPRADGPCRLHSRHACARMKSKGFGVGPIWLCAKRR